MASVMKSVLAILAGHVSECGIRVAGGADAGVGDQIITRQNDRRLMIGRRWVKNGDTWIAHAVGRDGSLTVRPEHGKGTVVLPTSYVHQHEVGDVDRGIAGNELAVLLA